jgi:hypothetical protein
MNDPEHELKKALTENGEMDSQKARRLATEAGSWFNARIKRDARITWLSVGLVVAVFEFAIIGFFLACNTKMTVGFAVLMVFALVFIVSFELQHRITNTKISLLRDIKLLRLERGGLPSGQVLAPAQETRPSDASLLHALSPRETLVWFLGFLLIAFAVGSFTFRLMLDGWLIPGGDMRTDECQVALLPDGSGSMVDKVSYRYQELPTSSFPIWCGENDTIPQWLDSQGRELPTSVATIDGKRQYTVHLAEPVMPGQQVSYTTVSEIPLKATKQGEIWTYRLHRWHVGNAYISTTVRLPQGAKIVSLDPESARQSVCDGVPTVRFQPLRGEEIKFTYTIQYRLPSKEKVEK